MIDSNKQKTKNVLLTFDNNGNLIRDNNFYNALHNYNNEFYQKEIDINQLDFNKIQAGFNPILDKDGQTLKYGENELVVERTIKLYQLSMYDKSISINQFYINDKEHRYWISDSDRISRYRLLESSLKIINSQLKKNNLPEYDGIINPEYFPLYLGNDCYKVEILQGIELLDRLIVEYASQCMIVTQTHYSNILKLQTIEEIREYNYTLDYPEKLILQLDFYKF